MRKNTAMSQKMMRGRVAAQGFTLMALVAGVLMNVESINSRQGAPAPPASVAAKDSP